MQEVVRIQAEIGSQAELIQAFRPRDQRLVEMPRGLRFPLRVQYYHTWADSAGVYRYLVTRHAGSGELYGLVFRRSRQSSMYQASRLCDWCHAYGPADTIDLMTVSPSSKRVVGLMLCIDLSCLQKLDIAGRMSRRSYESRANELCEKIDRFYDSTFEES